MTPEKCAKCLKPKSAQPGSLTQWIILCSCDRLSPSTPLSENEVIIPHCKVCGKPVREQRSGSLTQWIFQRDSCNCEIPEVELAPAVMPFNPAAFQVLPEEELVELEIESGKFPFERYAPLDILGEGSNGTVYLSHDRLLQKRVAVKVLRTFDRDALLAFQNEARATSKITHPHIIKVLDFGSTDGGVPFMVMELVSGTSLEKAIDERGGFDLDTSIRLFMQLAKALSYAHGLGILHRDLKPSNILIVETDNSLHSYLIDFGVAKLQTFYQAVTVFNGTALVGTPAYMSPDQASGRECDERSDIYSFGCVMFETITGRTLFSAETPLEVISMHAKQAPESILEFVNETPVSIALSDVIDKCLTKDPANRFQSADELRKALYAIPAEGPMEEVPRQKSLLNDGDEKLTKTAGPFEQPLLIAGVSLAILLFSGWMYYSVSVTKNASHDQKTAAKKNKKRAPNALGAMNLDEALARRPKQPMPKVLSMTLSNETDQGLEHLWEDYPNLEKLTILDSKISAAGIRYLRKVPVKILRLENMNITRQHFTELSQVPSLIHINFGPQNELDMSGIPELQRLPLLFIKFSYAIITQKNVDDIGKLKALTSVGFVSSRGLSKVDLAPLSNIPNLYMLDLSSSDVTDDTLKSLPQLRTVILNLNFTKITNAAFKIIAKTSRTGEVHVTENMPLDKQLIKNFEKQTKKRVIINPASNFNGVDPTLVEEEGIGL